MIRKRALDMVVEQFNKPTIDPRSDNTFDNPYRFKSVEAAKGDDEAPEPIQNFELFGLMSDIESAKTQLTELKARANAEQGKALDDATSACDLIVHHLLDLVEDNGTVAVKEARTVTHTTPREKPPRHDTRTLLDDDVKKELDADKKAGYVEDADGTKRYMWPRDSAEYIFSEDTVGSILEEVLANTDSALLATVGTLNRVKEWLRKSPEVLKAAGVTDNTFNKVMDSLRTLIMREVSLSLAASSVSKGASRTSR